MPPAFSFFGSPKGMPPKKEKGQQSATGKTISEGSLEKFRALFS